MQTGQAKQIQCEENFAIYHNETCKMMFEDKEELINANPIKIRLEIFSNHKQQKGSTSKLALG